MNMKNEDKSKRLEEKEEDSKKIRRRRRRNKTRKKGKSYEETRTKLPQDEHMDEKTKRTAIIVATVKTRLSKKGEKKGEK